MYSTQKDYSRKYEKDANSRKYKGSKRCSYYCGQLRTQVIQQQKINKSLTFVFTEEVNAFLQNCGLVHLSGVARQHCAKFFNEDIELVSSFLLRLVTGHAKVI